MRATSAAPVAGAGVTLKGVTADGAVFYSEVLSGPDGVYLIDAPPGEYALGGRERAGYTTPINTIVVSFDASPVVHAHDILFRRNASLREIDRRRVVLAETLRLTVQEVEEKERKLLDPPAKGEKAA